MKSVQGINGTCKRIKTVNKSHNDDANPYDNFHTIFVNQYS